MVHGRSFMSEEKQSLEGMTVCGFQGYLAGNERRLQGRLPCIKEIDERYFLITDVDNNTISFVGHCEAQAEESATMISPKEPFSYQTGKILAVGGSTYIKRLIFLSQYFPVIKSMISGFVEIQDEFQVMLITEDEYERLRLLIVEAAKALFDRHLMITGGISSVTQVALDVLRGTCTPHIMDYYVRELITRKLAGATKDFSDMIVLVSDDVKIPENDLTAIVDIWITAAKEGSS